MKTIAILMATIDLLSFLVLAGEGLSGGVEEADGIGGDRAPAGDTDKKRTPALSVGVLYKQ